MKATSKPFKASFTSGRCAACRRRILADTFIVKLEKTVTWIESKRLIPRGGGRFFVDQRSSQYAHDECMEAKDE